MFSRTVQLKPFMSMNSFDVVFLALRDREDVRLGDVSLVPMMLEFFGVAWEVYSMKTGMIISLNFCRFACFFNSPSPSRIQIPEVEYSNSTKTTSTICMMPWFC